jgi:pyridoxal phosphate enzyme (YggS family)
VREQIASAEFSAGRAEGSVRLIAVTKSHPFECVEAALEAGLRDLGENRVEELEAKVEHFGADAATWHMIGHLQSRKAQRAVLVADMVHSVDSLKLARRMSSGLSEDRGVVEVLAQVNTSGEESKSGFSVASALDEIAEMSELPGLRVKGLMTMAPFVEDEVVLTTAFASLRRLSESLISTVDGIGPELSMGMTNDLDIAIREGSTMVRIGTALFGPRTGYTT